MDSSRDRESVLRRRRERYRLQRERETPEGGDVLTVQVLSTSQNPVISDGNCYNEQCCVNG